MRVLAAHQPNYQPWVGLFHKVSQADVWVLADDVQFTSPGFINRNRIRTPGGSQWLTIPVQTKSRGTQQIAEVETVDQAWQRKHWEAIRHNYHQAAHFDEARGFLESFYAVPNKRLLDVNVGLIQWFLELLASDVEIRFSSQFDVAADRTQRLVDLVRRCECDAYLAGSGASKDYLQVAAFEEAGIELMFSDFKHPIYDQCHDGFEPNLSAIDLVLNCGASEARKVMGFDQT